MKCPALVYLITLIAGLFPAACSKLRQSVTSTEKTVKLVKDNYANGLVDFQNVLDTERTLVTVQDNAALSEGLVSGNYVRLFKALGGGTEAVVPTPERPANKADGGPPKE